MNTSFSILHGARAVSLSVLAALALLGSSAAQAGSVQITQAGQGDTVLTFPSSGIYNDGYTDTVAGTALTFTQPGKNIFTTDSKFFHFGSNSLMFGNSVTNPSGVGQIDFSQGVTEVGMQAQINLSGITTPEHFSFTAFSGAKPLGTYTVFGDAAFGPIPYLGVKATGGDLITRLTITGFNDTGAFNGPGPFAFAVGPVSFAAPQTTVPEPSGWASFGTGILGLSALALCARRRKRTLPV